MDVLSHLSALRSTNVTHAVGFQSELSSQNSLSRWKRGPLWLRNPSSPEPVVPSMRGISQTWHCFSCSCFCLLSSTPPQGEFQRRTWAGIPELFSLFIFLGDLFTCREQRSLYVFNTERSPYVFNTREVSRRVLTDCVSVYLLGHVRYKSYMLSGRHSQLTAASSSPSSSPPSAPSPSSFSSFWDEREVSLCYLGWFWTSKLK